MENGFLLTLGIITAVLLLFGGTAAAEPSLFAGGDGSLENPYQIENIEQLNAMREDLSANYILINDIDMSSYTVWYPIGTLEWNQGANTWNKPYPFTGTFDGAGFTIYNFTHLPETINPMDRQADGNESGLFGYIENAAIKNVRMENIEIASTIMDHNNVGPLVGQMENSSVTNCTTANGSVELTGLLWLADAGNAGGLIGKAKNSTIENCSSDVSVKTHFHRVGGLAGGLWNTNVTNCSASGDVSGRSVVGGLIGDSFTSDAADAYITDSFSTGNATGMTVPCKNTPYIGGGVTGGFIGWVSQSSSSGSTPGMTYISNCYSTGDATVENGTTAGGFVGEYKNGSISDCYATGNVYAKGYTYDNGTVAYGYAGGFAGKMEGGTIENSFVSNTVSTFSEAGGFAGQMTGGTISKCYAVTNTTSFESYAGGFVGNLRRGTIEESYAAGDVSAKHTAGGFAGFINDTASGLEIKINNTYTVCDVITEQNKSGGFAGHVNASGTNVTITNSYAAGSVRAGTGNTGGLIGVSTKNILSNSFYDNITTGMTATAGGTGGTGKNTAEMKNITVFENAGWDITKGETAGSSVWYILEDYSYPLLTAFYPETICIGSEEQLKMIGSRAYDYDADGSGQKKFWHTNADYVLISDIALSSDFDPVGSESMPFKGNLTNQNGYVISHLKINKPMEENTGFFGFAKNAVIDGILFEDVSIEGDYAAGTFAGAGINITLIDCAVTSGNVSAYQEAGGLIGKTDGAVLINCSFEGDAVRSNGTYYAGGLIGNASNVTAANSRAAVKEVYAENECAGGLIGAVSGMKSTLYRSSFIGNVTSGYTHAGGLVGQGENLSVGQSYAKGNVTADTHSAGGLVGALSNGTISESFATTGTVAAYGIAGGLIGFADGAEILIKDGIATNAVHTAEGKAGGLIGVSASSSPAKIQNSFALNQYVNGTNDVGSLVGTAGSGSVQADTGYSWTGMKNGETLLSTLPGIHGTGVGAADVWDTFDENGAWDTLSVKNNWQKDQYRRYLLPVLSWQEQPFIADALYLAPEEMQHLYFVAYAGNGNDVTGVPVDGGDYLLNDVVTVMSNETMMNGNLKFIEWNTQSDGKGESFLPGQTFEITEDVVLYAQWKSDGDGNQNTGSKSRGSSGTKIIPGEEIPKEGYETENLTPPAGNQAVMPLILSIFLTAIGFYAYRRRAEEDEN